VNTSDRIIIALLVSILARTYLPPVGIDSTGNRVAIMLTQLAAAAFIGWSLA
jgi:hypothetical protein